MNNKIIAQARSWIGTRFKHQGRIKRHMDDPGGCDCLGLVIGIAKALNLQTIDGNDFELFDQHNYPLLLSSNILLDQLGKLLMRVENIQPGDVILFKINSWPQHLALVSTVEPEIVIIHSYIQARKIVEQHLPQDWQDKIVAVYRFN